MRLTCWISTAALAVTLTACEPSTPAPRVRTPTPMTSSARGDLGTVAGVFTMEGGPIRPDGTQRPPMPLRGTLTFAAGHRGVVAVQVGKNGRFALSLPAGTYAVAGRSPSILEVLATGASVEEQCSQPTSVTVVAGRTVHLSVVCVVP